MTGSAFDKVIESNPEINAGDIVAVIGPSGTGKSTFLRSINMLEPPTSGKIFLDDIEVTAPDCDLSFVRK